MSVSLLAITLFVVVVMAGLFKIADAQVCAQEYTAVKTQCNVVDVNNKTETCQGTTCFEAVKALHAVTKGAASPKKVQMECVDKKDELDGEVRLEKLSSTCAPEDMKTCYESWSLLGGGVNCSALKNQTECDARESQYCRWGATALSFTGHAMTVPKALVATVLMALTLTLA